MKELIEDVIYDLMLSMQVNELKIELCEQSNEQMYVHLL